MFNYLRPTKSNCTNENVCSELFHDGERYHIETSTLICRANQWTGFYDDESLNILVAILNCLSRLSCSIIYVQRNLIAPTKTFALNSFMTENGII